MRETIDRKGMSVLSSGHLATDFASGAVPALLPFFTVKFDLSYTLTAVLILAALGRFLQAAAAECGEDQCHRQKRKSKHNSHSVFLD